MNRIGVEVSGAVLAVSVVDGDGPVVVLGHGVGSSAMFLHETFGAAFAAAGLRLAAVDLRGHGDSSSARALDDHALDVHAADLARVCQTLGAAGVGGVSIGAMAAVRAVAGGLCVKAVLAVIPGWTGRSPAGHGPHAALATEIRSVGVAGMLARLEAEPELPAWVREVVLRDYRRHDVDSLRAALLSLDGAEGPSLAEIKSIDAPLAVVGWPDDPGHPLLVAESWSEAAGTSSMVQTSIAAMQDDRAALGVAACSAFALCGFPG
ncbi:MAG: pimeloyl-ACP methyl ester carboxylesterase [Glaciecola sp.]